MNIDILDDFEKDFNNAYSLSSKERILEQLLSKNLDFSSDKDKLEEYKESIKEYKAHLSDFKEALAIEEDSLINKEIDENLYTQYTCIDSIGDYVSGLNYYVFVDDVSESYQESGIDQVSDKLKEYINNIRPIYFIILDEGIGTLKRKTVFEGDFIKHFAKLVF